MEHAQLAMIRDRPVGARGAARIGADAVLEELEAHGCNVVFGYPGGVLLPIYDVLGRHPLIRHVLVRHEQGAVHGADGYARAAGITGVCLGTSGPGATNLVTGIATAWRSQTSILVITGNVNSGSLGRDAFQEIDITGITLPITKANTLVRSGADIRASIRAAMRVSVASPPGPTHVDITKDALEAEVSPTSTSVEPIAQRYEGVHELEWVSDNTSESAQAETAVGSRLRQLLRVAGRDPVVLDGGLQSLAPGLRRAGLHVWGPGPFDTQGYAIPAALGASLAVGGPSWAITDPIGFQRSCRELVTITQEAAPVRIIHVANRRGVAIPFPDAVGIAAACGVPGIRVRRWEELRSACGVAAESDRAILVSFELG